MSADPDFTLLPLEDDVLTPDADVDAAAASVVTDDEGDVTTVAPLGRSWDFDFQKGRFNRTGGAPTEVRGSGALEMRCLMAAYSARGAHAVFPDDFGMEDPDRGIGDVDPAAAFATWEDRLREALTGLDNVSNVENVQMSYDQNTGIYSGTFDVIRDDEDRLTVGPFTLTGGFVA